MKIIFATTACLAALSVSAGTYNWSGGGTPNGNWSSAANWGGSAPDPNTINLLNFSGVTQQTSTNNIGSMTNALVFANGGFRLDFTAQPNWLDAGAGITNLAGSNVVTGNLNLIGSGANAYFFNIPAGTLKLNTMLTGSFGAVGRKTGAGLLILNGTNSPALSGSFLIDSASISADDGAVRVTSSAAATNFQTINILNNGNGRSTLQLDGSTGGVNLDVRAGNQVRLNINMRNGFVGTVPHVQNLAGTNSVGGGDGGKFQVNVGASAPGTNAIFQSDAGLLTIYGTNSSGNLGKYNFVFSGAGNGVIAAQLFDGSSSVTPTTASLIKTDGGTWTINTNLYFSGNITVNGGTLAMGTYGVAANCASFVVSSNTIFDLTAPIGGWSLGAAQTLAGTGTVKGNVTTTDGSFVQPGGAGVAGTLTFSNNLILSAATTNSFDLTSLHGIGGGTNDLIKVVGNLTPNGAPIFINALSSLTTGTYRLFNYTGTKTGSFGSLAFSGVATGFIDETVAGQINLVVTSVQPPQNLRWTGGSGATWDTGVTANWTTNATPDVNFFSPGDVVTFNDSSIFTNVSITANVQPSSVTFNVTNAPYTISGAGMNVGSGGLTKNGPAVLMLDCSNNFNGPFRVNGGILQLSPTYGGTAMSATSSNIFASGTTLDLNGKDAGESPIYISGIGVGGQGAIVSSAFSSSSCGMRNVTLTGDTLVDTSGSPIHFFGFFGLGGAPEPFLKGQGFKLTVQGTNKLFLNGFNGLFSGALRDPDLGNIEIRSGSTLEPYYFAGLGRAASNCLVRAGGTLAFFGTGTNAAYKNLILEGGSFFVSASGTNSFNGPVQLTNGNALITPAGGYPFTINSTISGAGGFATTNGTGTLILTGPNAYIGPTTVNTSTLWVNGSLASASAVTVNSGYLGGIGTINGPVTVQTDGTLAPGTNIIGTLTINNSLTIRGNLLFKLNESVAPSNDLCVVSGVLTNAGAGTLILSVSGPAVVLGDRFKLFNKAVLNGGALTISPALSWPLKWANNLAADGSIQVVLDQPTLSATVNGGNLELTWPEQNLGWSLQVQTNRLNVGLSNNWSYVPDSELATNFTMPIIRTNPAVFFRLVSP